MPRKPFLIVSVMLLIVLSILLLAVSTSGARASVAQPAPTPDANAILDQAATAVTVANQTASQADRESAMMANLLSWINDLSVIIPILVGVGVGILGYFGIRSFRDLEKRGSGSLEKIDEMKKEIDKKKQEIDELHQKLTRDVEKTSRAIAFLILGNEFAEKGKNGQAIEAYQAALRLREHDPQAHYALGRIYNDIGAYDLSIEHLTTALAADPDLPQTHKELGFAYRLQADREYQRTHDAEKRFSAYTRAIEHFRRANELLPNYEEAIAGLAGTYRRLNQYALALDYYKLARKANPQSSYAISNIAALALHEGDIETALPAFEQTMETAQKRIAARASEEPYWDYYDLSMAILVLKKGDAVAAYKAAIELTPASGVFQSVLDGLAFLKEAESKYPIEHLDEVIAMVTKAKAAMEVQEKAIGAVKVSTISPAPLDASAGGSEDHKVAP